MNIAIGKIGKSLLFDSGKWGLVGGDSAPCMLYTNLAYLFPQHDFYIIGRSDLNKLSFDKRDELFPNGNVYYCMPEDEQKYLKDEDIMYMHAIDYLNENGITLHTGLIFNGMSGTSTIPNRILKVDGSGKTTNPLFQIKAYCGGITHTLNETQIPFALISEDPRHIDLKSRDLFNRPKVILSQCKNYIHKSDHIKSYEDQRRVACDVPVIYAQTERIFMMGETYNDVASIEKSMRVNCFVNGHGINANESRYDFVNEFVLKNFDDAIIYGNWPDDCIETGRFSKKRMGDIKDVVKGTKYTPVISIKPGFVTCKPFEMLNFGILPFLHKSYDVHDLLQWDPFLVIDSPEDFKQKVEYLENNEQARQYVLHGMYERYFTPEYLNGTALINMYMELLASFVGESFDEVESNDFMKISNFVENGRF